jgi:hypothetical protein
MFGYICCSNSGIWLDYQWFRGSSQGLEMKSRVKRLLTQLRVAPNSAWLILTLFTVIKLIYLTVLLTLLDLFWLANLPITFYIYITLIPVLSSMGALKSYLLVILSFIQLLDGYLFSFINIFKIKFGSQKKYGSKFLRPNHLLMLIDENLEKYPSTFSFIDLRIINCEEKLIHEDNIKFIIDISKKEPNLAEVPNVWKPEWVFEKISFTEWKKVRLSFLELIKKQ